MKGSDRYIVCDRCKGKGSYPISGFIHYSDGSFGNHDVIPCSYCYRTGKVSPDQLKAQRIGEFIKEGRKELRITLREQAKILGMSLPELNAIEQGRIYG